jgi:hypothetical protein
VDREGDPLPVYIEETARNFAVGWTGTHRVDGKAFVYSEQSLGVSALFWATQYGSSSSRQDLKISNIFG